LSSEDQEKEGSVPKMSICLAVTVWAL